MSKKREVKVWLTDDSEAIIKLDNKELGDLKRELAGTLPYIQEYKTTRGNIITGLDIVRAETNQAGYVVLNN